MKVQCFTGGVTLRLKSWPQFQKTCSPSTVLAAALDKLSSFSLPQFPKPLFMHRMPFDHPFFVSSRVPPVLRVVGLQSGNSSRHDHNPAGSENRWGMSVPAWGNGLWKLQVAENAGGVWGANYIFCNLFCFG